MFCRIASTAALLVPIATAAAAAREPEQLKLEGKWVADYDTDACHLIGQFGAGDNAVYARFTRYEPGDHFNLDVISKRLRSYEPRSDAKIDFGLDDTPLKQKVWRGSVGERGAAYFRNLRLADGDAEGESRPASTELEKRVSSIAVTVPGARPFRLVFPSLDKPMAAMRTCITGLIKSWGYDPAADAALSRRAAPTEFPGNWFRPSDYPQDARQGGHNGIVQFRLDIDPEGKIVGCHILARTNPDDFADRTCQLITRRGKFTPALDAAQKPVRSYYINRVQWQMTI